MDGLFLREKLSKNMKFYEKDKHMKRMLEKLQERAGVKFLSEEECAELEMIDFVAPTAPAMVPQQVDAF